MLLEVYHATEIGARPRLSSHTEGENYLKISHNLAPLRFIAAYLTF